MGMEESLVASREASDAFLLDVKAKFVVIRNEIPESFQRSRHHHHHFNVLRVGHKSKQEDVGCRNW